MNSKKTSGERRIRVVMAKPGLDGHDVGAKVVALALKDAGMEVIYTGLHRTIDEIVKTALEEDADAIGLSIYSGAHLALSKKLMGRLKEMGVEDILVLVGGNIPKKDIGTLQEYGVAGVFPVGTRLGEIIDFIHKKLGAENEKK